MSNIIEIFKSVLSVADGGDDDFVDRLSNKCSVCAVLVFAAGISVYMNIGDPVICWCDKHFEDKWVDYANAYCWVKNTYHLPFKDEIPPEGTPDSEKTYIVFYQWLPIILVCQAMGFYFPKIFWRAHNQKCGIDATTVLDLCQNIHHGNDIKSNNANLLIVRNHIDRFVGSRKRKQKTAVVNKKLLLSKSKAANGKDAVHAETNNGGFLRADLYLALLYLLTKLFYLSNAVIQFFFVNYIFSLEFSNQRATFWEWTTYFWRNKLFPKLDFPRLTMCDFFVRRLGNLHAYTVQCVLPLNLYNEMIYHILWFWLFFLVFINTFSLILWIARLLSSSERVRYIERHLKIIRKTGEQHISIKRQIQEFSLDYLGQDGIFLLRLIGHNTSSCLVGELVAVLWDKWL